MWYVVPHGALIREEFNVKNGEWGRAVFVADIREETIGFSRKHAQIIATALNQAEQERK